MLPESFLEEHQTSAHFRTQFCRIRWGRTENLLQVMVSITHTSTETSYPRIEGKGRLSQLNLLKLLPLASALSSSDTSIPMPTILTTQHTGPHLLPLHIGVFARNTTQRDQVVGVRGRSWLEKVDRRRWISSLVVLFSTSSSKSIHLALESLWISEIAFNTFFSLQSCSIHPSMSALSLFVYTQATVP